MKLTLEIRIFHKNSLALMGHHTGGGFLSKKYCSSLTLVFFSRLPSRELLCHKPVMWNSYSFICDLTNRKAS